MKKFKKDDFLISFLINIFFNFYLLLRRFSQSKFHFDFEDELPPGPRRLRSLSRYLLKIAVYAIFLTQITFTAK